MQSNVPIGAFTLISIVAFLKLNISGEGPRMLSFKEKLRYMDTFGTIIFTGAIACLLLALQWGGQTKPWNAPEVIVLFLLTGLLFAGFCYIQWRRGETAIIPLRVFRQRSILMGSFFLFFYGMTPYVVSQARYVSASQLC